MSRKKGYVGEGFAIKYLESKNFNFLHKNYYSQFGEIDLILENLKYILFVEVKMRKKNPFFSGLESISLKKQKNIIRTAYEYLRISKKLKQPRFDVVSIELDSKTNTYSVNHIENAFGMEGYIEAF